MRQIFGFKALVWKRLVFLQYYGVKIVLNAIKKQSSKQLLHEFSLEAAVLRCSIQLFSREHYKTFKKSAFVENF